MGDGSTGAPLRLRESGVGVTAGGAVLAWSSFVTPPLVSAGLVLLAAIVWYLLKPPFGRPGRTALGIAIVGGIGLIEASPLGLGLDHLWLGFFAMALGMFDIVVGLTIQRWQRGY